MHNINTTVLQAVALRLGLIALIFVKFIHVTFDFCFTCPSNVRLESRCQPRYLTIWLCCIGLLLKSRWDVFACFSICLEPNIMNLVLSLLNLRWIDIIQSGIFVGVLSMVLIVFSSDVWHLAVKDSLCYGHLWIQLVLVMMVLILWLVSNSMRKNWLHYSCPVKHWI